MKTFLLILIFITTSSALDTLEWVDEQINAIKPPRTSISKASINKVKSPFVYVKPKKKKIESTQKVRRITPRVSKSQVVSQKENKKITKKDTKPVLSAIINNSALINGKWYKANDRVGNYILKEVKRKTVVLIHKSNEMGLSTDSSNRKLKFKNN